MAQKLKLGIPKGSLESATITLFDQAGWKITPRARHYFPTINDDEISCKLVKSKELGPYVENGVLDCGLTGRDWIIENNSDIEEICSLNYSKASDQGCRWVIIVKNTSPIQTLQDLSGKTIVTELTRFTQQFFQDKGIDATVQHSWGATEAKVVEGLADAAVEITETGSTIRAHGLRIVEDILHTHTVFVANKQALRDPFRRQKIENIALMLESAMAARQKVLLKLNAPVAKLESIIEVLPSLHAPTINKLHSSDWAAVETVVSRLQTRELIPKLKASGAEGILELNLTKLVN